MHSQVCTCPQAMVTHVNVSRNSCVDLSSAGGGVGDVTGLTSESSCSQASEQTVARSAVQSSAHCIHSSWLPPASLTADPDEYTAGLLTVDPDEYTTGLLTVDPDEYTAGPLPWLMSLGWLAQVPV